MSLFKKKKELFHCGLDYQNLRLKALVMFLI